MRGKADTQVTMLSLVTADDLVPGDHPIREIKPIVDGALTVQMVSGHEHHRPGL